MKTGGRTSTRGNPKSTREAVGVFLDAEHLNTAIGELLAAGFERDELGLLASEHAVQQKLGGVYARIDEVRNAPHASDVAFVKNESVEDTVHGLTGGLYFAGGTAAVGAVVVSAAVIGGPLAVAIAAAAAVGAVGALVEGIINKSDADYLREQLDEGRLLLFVRGVRDTASAKRAVEIMSRHAAVDVRLYKVPAKAE